MTWVKKNNEKLSSCKSWLQETRELNFLRSKVIKAPKYCRENAPELVLEAKQNQCDKLVLELIP